MFNPAYFSFQRTEPRISGEFQGGEIHGQGTYYFNDKSVYEGELIDGYFHGKGTYRYAESYSEVTPGRNKRTRGTAGKYLGRVTPADATPSEAQVEEQSGKKRTSKSERGTPPGDRCFRPSPSPCIMTPPDSPPSSLLAPPAPQRAGRQGRRARVPGGFPRGQARGPRRGLTVPPPPLVGPLPSPARTSPPCLGEGGVGGGRAMVETTAVARSRTALSI